MGKRFYNEHIQGDKKGLIDFVLWKLGYWDDAKPPVFMPKDFCYPGLKHLRQEAGPRATWIGHSTYLIETESASFLTDPVWNKYCSPVPIPLLKRRSTPPLAIDELPPIDFVLISHNHYDHLDLPSVRQIQRIKKPSLWVVSSGLKPWFDRRGIGPCVELGWWQEIALPGCTIEAVPAQHFSGRSLWDRNKTHWNGYVVTMKKEAKKIYFAGDSGYNEVDFKKIGARFGGIDVSMLPIGTYVPRKFMAPVHCSPWDAVEIHQDVQSNLSLGMHWATFALSEEPLDRPPFDLYLAMKEKNLPFETFLPIVPGTTVSF